MPSDGSSSTVGAPVGILLVARLCLALFLLPAALLKLVDPQGQP